MNIFTPLLIFLILGLTIKSQTPYPNNSGSGLKCWLKADAGVIGATPISQWNDQSGAGITGNFQPSFWNLCPPDLLSNSFNYNPTMSFNSSSPTNWCGAIGLYSQNTFPGNSLFDPLENSIFMVKEVHFGLVELKWEDNFTGAAFRMGVEMTGTGTQRFDFVDASSGQVSGSTTNIVNIFHMGEYFTDANNLSLYLNGALDYSIPNPGLAFTPPPANTCGLSVGSNPPNWPLWADENISEVMIFNKKLSFSEQRRVESYLALKYGLTLGNNQLAGPALNYMACDNTLIWDNHTGYHNHVIGIGRDNGPGGSGLNQLKSKGEASLNGTVDMIKIANGNFTVPAPFDRDSVYIIAGSNLGSLTNLIFSTFTHANPLTTLYAQMARIWAIQRTGNPTGNLIIEFDMSLLNGPNANSNIRLLMDNDANFANNSAGESTYSPLPGYAASGGLIYFSVPYSAIPAKGYFTLASADISSAPLPVTLKNFTGKCQDGTIQISWSTILEHNCNYYELSRSEDALNFSSMEKQFCKGNGVSNQIYTFYDRTTNPHTNYYYKLTQTDNNSGAKSILMHMVSCDENGSLSVVNVSNSKDELTSTFYIPFKDVYTICIMDALGKIIVSEQFMFDKGFNTHQYASDQLMNGNYVLRISNGGASAFKKFTFMR